MTRLLAIAVAVIAIGGGAYWYLTQSTPAVAEESAAVVQASDEIDTSIVQEMSIGNPDADVTVIEYASYTCPHCRNFHAGPFKDLKSDYIDTGKINFIYREVYFDLPGVWAGIVARCAGPDRFFGVVEELYNQQTQWSRQESAAAIASELRRIGRTAGIEPDALEACLADADKAKAMTAVDEANRAEHGVNSTPSFVINGTTYRNMAYDEFKSLIDAELEG
ncbi:MAG: DsbA family protein [Pseudomonadota bacterium]